MIYIYKITNILNNKCYVGQTRNIKNRWKAHARKNDSLISKAIAKYGLHNFEFEVIDNAEDQEEADEKETHYIQAHLVPNGYNRAPTATQARQSKIPAETQQMIIAQYLSDVPVSDIAQQAGYSIGAIVKTLRRHNIAVRNKLPIKRNRPSKIDVDKLRQLLREGKSTAEIAVEFNTNYKYVWKYIKYHDIEEYNTKPTRDRQSKKD